MDKTNEKHFGLRVDGDILAKFRYVCGFEGRSANAQIIQLMNFSRSGRTVEESRAWLKRIAITWAILNGLGFIMAYVTPFFSGGQWTA